ncbi:MAG: hypothetical protein MJY48_01630 [Bacteroidales bacterium]|nr:hypothetical protein [Bacteroidales bacterium]
MIVLLASAMTLCACNRQENPYVLAYGTVTMRPTADGSYFMEVAENTALTPRTKVAYPFKESEKRLIIRYADYGPATISIQGYSETRLVDLQAADTIATKAPVPHTSDDAAAYGNDKIGLYLGDTVFPTTMIEDGYLCVAFVFPFSDPDNNHTINLVYGANPDDPYEVQLRYNAGGDEPLMEGQGYINFPLKSLPDTNGKTVKLTLKWNSSATGTTASTSFDYCSRTDW